MSRLQLGLNVQDLDTAIAFYTKLFGTAPHKVRPGYANFAIANPPLKLVLFEGAGEAGAINHLGVEFESADLVADSLERLAAAELPLYDVGTVTCCYARSDKGWVDSPEGHKWEMYTVLADADEMHDTDFVPKTVGSTTTSALTEAACCGAPLATDTANVAVSAASGGCC